MKNLSFRLVKRVEDIFPGSVHVAAVQLTKSSDREVFDYAKRNDCLIVTLDADFFEMATVLGHPPKVIWLRCGNSSTDTVEGLLRKHHGTILEFFQDPDSPCPSIDL